MPVISAPNYNYNFSNNFTECIPHDQFVAMLPHIVLKTDAIKLGVCCFIAGIILGYAILYFRQKLEEKE